MPDAVMSGAAPGTGLAAAKINLFLHVAGRRADGYHLLDSLVVFTGAADRLTVEPADDFSLEVSGPFGAVLAVEPDNLVLRAGRALAAANGIAPRGALRLGKNLPVASGIGGGSADAAAALRLLARLWDVPDDPAALANIALDLGADVPVCLASRPARMSGIGEVLGPAPMLPSYGLVLVNPGVPVATPAVFRARSGPFSAPAALPSGWRDATDMSASLAGLSNDLEAPAISLCPPVSEVLSALREVPTCLLARMSGSGATCFGLFADEASARAASARLARPGWWVWGGGPLPSAAADL